VSEESRRKQAQDDARLLELQTLLAAALEDKAATTIQGQEDPISSSTDKKEMVRLCLPRQGSECVICLQAEAMMALMPCGHLCLCEAPACMLKLCPLCRAPVVEVKRIYG